VKLLLRRRAGRQIDAAKAWWVRNRDKAPQAFDEEINRAFAVIAESPTIGIIQRTRRSGVVRRITLERIRYYLFYRIRRDSIEVILLWHTSRRPPRL